MKRDIIAIGDTVIDNFIRLKDARVTCDIDSDRCTLCMRFADKIPFEFSIEVPAVGNSANAAVAAARLGLSASLHSYLGKDVHGERCIEALKSAWVDMAFIETQVGKNTNYHFVLWFESERTILIKHEKFEYSLPQITTNPKWVYLSSLGENSLPFHAEIAGWLARNPDIKLAFQPGTYQIRFGAEALRDIYRHTHISSCNKEEAQLISGEFSSDPLTLLKAMRALGPKVVIITDGTNGAYALDEEDKAWRIPMYPDPREPYERTGAGDAFSSTIVSALALGVPLHDALLWGPINSMAVVQDIGAQKGLLTRQQLEEYLTHAPATYTLTPLA